MKITAQWSLVVEKRAFDEHVKKSILLMPNVILTAIGRAPTSGYGQKGKCCKEENRFLLPQKQEQLLLQKKN